VNTCKHSLTYSLQIVRKFMILSLCSIWTE